MDDSVGIPSWSWEGANIFKVLEYVGDSSGSCWNMSEVSENEEKLSSYIRTFSFQCCVFIPDTDMHQ